MDPQQDRQTRLLIPPGQRELDLSWLVRLRWIAAAGQTAAVLVATTLLAIELPLSALLGIITVGIATNLLLATWLRRSRPIRNPQIATIMATDILVLTALLALSGGAANPFTTLYLVYLALATIILSPLWAWGLVVLACTCFGFLFLGGTSQQHHMEMANQLHLQGMWVAFALGAGFIVYFGQRVQGMLNRRNTQLVSARDSAARADRLAALTTLAAGAAHELSTPLSTIAIAARELERGLEKNSAVGNSLEDARLIRGEVERCRGILSRLSAETGDPSSGSFDDCRVNELLEDALCELPDRARVSLQIDEEIATSRVALPREAIGQAVRSLTRNALQASSPNQPVELHCLRDAKVLRIEIRDHGSGMSQDVVRHAGEPFFTTRMPGQGIGLGLFLARSVVERLGGALDLESEEGGGTQAILTVPVEKITAGP